MQQLSLFAAESEEPSPSDLAGLLAAGGHAVATGAGARISIIVDDPWRARAILLMMEQALPAGRPQAAEILETDEGRRLARTDPAPELRRLAGQWQRGAAKRVPDGWTPSARALRAWSLAAGRAVDGHYLLGLDPHAEQTHQPLAAALARAGIAVTVIGPRGGGPAVRVTGRRRLARLRENIGDPPPDAPPDAWPPV
ncbi:hypothetical protein [Tomitella fengzijianii]|uniref:Uncharacterized protein n=1 Tax=Tomitella fengzijianii TaxID=2597660 RepID=A0A516X074_9ACTN|nr:hypothetical protein [Tomitella fengzijianii]QDQ96458.1 hypothetical protein FO059_02755 [Tomitella fengzijianii]